MASRGRTKRRYLLIFAVALAYWAAHFHAITVGSSFNPDSTKSTKEVGANPASRIGYRCDQLGALRGGFIQFNRVRDLFTQVDSYRAPNDVSLRLEKTTNGWVIGYSDQFGTAFWSKSVRHSDEQRTSSAPSEAGALQEVKVLYLEGIASHQGIESWTKVGNDEVKR